MKKKYWPIIQKVVFIGFFIIGGYYAGVMTLDFIVTERYWLGALWGSSSVGIIIIILMLLRDVCAALKTWLLGGHKR